MPFDSPLFAPSQCREVSWTEVELKIRRLIRAARGTLTADEVRRRCHLERCTSRQTELSASERTSERPRYFLERAVHVLRRSGA